MSSPPPPEFTYDVFISYSHRDKTWVRGELLPRLEGAGLKVCIDYRDFRIGAPIIKEMERAVLTSRRTLLVLTATYLTSAWAEFENLMLQTLDPTNQQFRLIPLILEQGELPLRIRGLNYVDLTQADDLAFLWQRLLDALAAPADAGPSPQKEPPMDDTRPTPASAQEHPGKDTPATAQVDVDQQVGMVQGGQVFGVVQGNVTINVGGPGSVPATPTPAPASNTAAVRELVMAAFGDEELTTFCYDNFRPVYEEFTIGMSRTQKTQRLVETCDRRGEIEKLLAGVARANPYQYDRFRNRLAN